MRSSSRHFRLLLQVLPQMLRDLQIPQAAQCLGLDLARARGSSPVAKARHPWTRPWSIHRQRELVGAA
jgi:hypothetical protein